MSSEIYLYTEIVKWMLIYKYEILYNIKKKKNEYTQICVIQVRLKDVLTQFI